MPDKKEAVVKQGALKKNSACKEQEKKQDGGMNMLSIIEKAIKLPKLMQWAKKEGIDEKKLYQAVYNKKANTDVPQEALLYILYAYMSQMPKTPPYHAASYKTDIVELHKVPEADHIADLIGKEALEKLIVSNKTALEICFFFDAEVNKEAKNELKIKAEKTEYSEEVKQVKVPLFPVAFKYSKKALISYENSSSDPYYEYFSHPKMLQHAFLLPYCRYADENQIADLIKTAENLMNNWGKIGRLASVIIRSALLLSDTKEAASYLDKYGHLGLYASMRSTTAQEIRKSLLSESGLNADGSASFDL